MPTGPAFDPVVLSSPHAAKENAIIATLTNNKSFMEIKFSFAIYEVLFNFLIVKYQTIDVYHHDFVPGWQQTALSDFHNEGGNHLLKEHLSNNNQFRHSLRMFLAMKCDKELSYIDNIQEFSSKYKC